MYVQLLQDTVDMTRKHRFSVTLNIDWWSRYSLLYLTALTVFNAVMGYQILLHQLILCH